MWRPRPRRPGSGSQDPAVVCTGRRRPHPTHPSQLLPDPRSPSAIILVARDHPKPHHLVWELWNAFLSNPTGVLGPGRPESAAPRSSSPPPTTHHRALISHSGESLRLASSPWASTRPPDASAASADKLRVPKPSSSPHHAPSAAAADEDVAPVLPRRVRARIRAQGEPLAPSPCHGVPRCVVPCSVTRG